METLEAIHTRRSVRTYTDKPVSDEAVEKILKAAMMAPSAGNQQPWHFVVIRDRETLKSIPSVHPHARMAERAALAVLICADLELETHEGYWIQDCAAATQNLLLAAHDLGLGAVWTGIYPREERVEGIKRMFDLPGSVIPLALVPIGQYEGRSRAVDRFIPERIHMDRW